jgi:general stress protein YciG
MANTNSGAGQHTSPDSHGKGGPAKHDASAAAGQKGTTQGQVGSGKERDPNNFANNPDRAAAAGQKGGQHSHDRG